MTPSFRGGSSALFLNLHRKKTPAYGVKDGGFGLTPTYRFLPSETIKFQMTALGLDKRIMAVRRMTLLVSILASWHQPVLAGSKLETFVLSAGGQSNYPTFGTPLPVYTHFGGYGPSVPSNPAGLAASGIGGEFQHATDTSSPLQAAYNYSSGTWSTTWSGVNSYSGRGAASARYGEVRAMANGTFTGWGDSFTVAGSEAFAVFTEAMTITSPAIANGSAGTVRFTFTVEGAMTETGDAGQVGIKSIYKWGNDPANTIVEASVSLNFGPSFFPWSGSGRDGFTIAGNVIQGQGSFDSLALPFTFGQPAELTVGLLSYNTPVKNTAASVNFAVRITGISVDGVTNFAIATNSNTVLTPTGVSTNGLARPEIIDASLNNGTFRILATGLDPTRRYLLKRSANLADGFPVIVDGPRFPGNTLSPTSDFFTDTSAGSPRGFYRLDSEP